MLDFLGYHGHRGCLTLLIEFVVLLSAIVSIAMGEAKAYDWGIVIGVVVDALLAFLSRWAERNRYKRPKNTNPEEKKSPPDE